MNTSNERMPGRKRLLAAVLFIGAALLGGCTVMGPAEPSTDPAKLPQLRPGVVAGYLPREQLVDSLALLPPPPVPGSAAQAADEEARRAAIPGRGSARWELAARDADYRSVRAVDAFACTIGVAISPEATPHLNMLLRRTLVDAGLGTYKAKTRYNRTRPFVEAKDSTCAPQDEEALRKDGSYPSGHSAFGWAWALILAEMAPDRADAILRRGYDYGQSRVYCGFHWQSDVYAGRVVGAAVVAQLHANPDFVAQFRAAQKEVAAARTSGKPAPDCTLERRAGVR